MAGGEGADATATSLKFNLYWIVEGAMFLHANNEIFGQTARMRRLIRLSVGRTCQKVRLFYVVAKNLII